MSQSSTPRSFVHPFAPWYVRARPLLIAALALVLIGLALALPRPAPAAPATQAGGGLLYAIDGETLVMFDLQTGERLRTVYDVSNLPGFYELSLVTTGSDGNIYLVETEVTGTGSSSTILSFDGQTGAPRGVFLDFPGDIVGNLVPAPDDQIYILLSSSAYYPTFQRYRLSDGAYLGPFIETMGTAYPPPGVPPRLSVTDFQVGPDGRVYAWGITSPDDGGSYSVIVRFDRATGAFLNTILGPASGLDNFFMLASDGTLYLSEQLFSDNVLVRNRIVRYSLEGVLQGTVAELPFRTGYAQVGPDGYLYLGRMEETELGPAYTGALVRIDPQNGAILNEYVVGVPGLFSFVGLSQEETRPVRRANVGLSQRSSPTLGVARSELVTLTLTATNRGEGGATDATINVPIDPARVQLLDAQFSRAGAWVSARRDDGVTIQTGRLGSGGDTITATLRLLVRADAPDGPLFPSRPTLRWSDAATGGASAANLLPVAAAGQSLDAPTLPLTIDPPSAAPGVARNVSAGWLTPGEPVSLWYDRPDGTSVALGRATATADGTISYQLTTAGLAPGRYQLVAQGVSSGVTLVGAFEVRQ